MHVNKNEMPVTAESPGYVGKWAELGDMHFAFESCVAGYDMDSLVADLPDRACPAEHWGYLFTGEVRVEYTDGTEEHLKAGDGFHIKPGHRPYMAADTEILQLTRAGDFHELTRLIADKVPGKPAGS